MSILCTHCLYETGQTCSVGHKEEWSDDLAECPDFLDYLTPDSDTVVSILKYCQECEAPHIEEIMDDLMA